MIAPFRLLGLLAIAANLATIASAQTAAPIRLKARRFVPAGNVHVRQPSPEPGAGRRSAQQRRYLLVQFTGPVAPGDLAALRAAGARPLRYVPENTVAISAPPGFNPAVLTRARWVGELEPSDKLSAESVRDLSAAFPGYPLTVIEFQPDVTPAEIQERLTAAGTTSVPSTALPRYMTIIPTDPAAVASLAADPSVAWIYPGTTDLLAGGALICEGLLSAEGVVANYATVGDGWDGAGLSAATLSYYFGAGSTDLGPSLQAGEITRALSEWARFADVRWRPALAADEPRSLTMMWAPRDHGDSYPFSPEVLAHAFYPSPTAPESLAGDIHFNDAYEWGVGDPGRYDIFSIALHESGHSLGLAHSSNPAAVMYPHYQGIVQGPAPDDVRAIQSLYAPSTGGSLLQSWRNTAIGAGIDGDAASEDGRFTLSATGRDIWGTADELRFAWRPLSGNGDIVARIDSLQAVHRWSKAGIMIRGSAAAGAPHAFMLVSGASGLAFQRRTVADGVSTTTDGGAGAAPRWLWLSRRGDRISAYAAVDRGAWRLVGSDTIRMGEQVLAGLALASHDPAVLATAVFSNVSVAPAPAWREADVGAVGTPGSWSTTATGMRVAGAGADIWGTTDAFHFVWVPLTGDGEVVARVASVQNVHAWTKAGVMIRESLAPGAPHALMLVSSAKGYAFQRRATRDGTTVSTGAGTGSAPQWVMLRRRGNVLSAFRSTDGITWTAAGSQTVAMQQQVLAGLAVSSHVPTTTSQAVFDNVQIR